MGLQAVAWTIPDPDPDALLAAAAKAERGHLKVFLGAAPGVGKTWAMLTQARRRRDEGADVLAGVIETHGRAETQAQIGDLPILPRLPVAYRGQTLEEFDLDAALARRPRPPADRRVGPHQRPPAAGTTSGGRMWTSCSSPGSTSGATLNVQHLESLNEHVARITGVRVAETLPDRVLERADEIELIDVPPAELRARLTSGRIYRADTARRALDGYFKEGNLAALREIALRQAAEHVDEDVISWMRASGRIRAPGRPGIVCWRWSAPMPWAKPSRAMPSASRTRCTPRGSRCTSSGKPTRQSADPRLSWRLSSAQRSRRGPAPI